MMRSIALSCGLLCLGLLIGCSGGSSVPTLQLRVVHASVDAPAVDVYVQGNPTPVFSGLAYGEVTPRVTLAAGNEVFVIRASPSTVADPPAFVSGPVDLQAGSDVTVVAAGLLASAVPEEAFRLLPLAEGFVPVAAGEAAVRILHAGADAPTVDLDVGDDGSPEVVGLSRWSDTGAAGIALPAGTALELGVLAGTPSARVTGFNLPALPDGGEVLVIATGRLDPDQAFGARFSLLAIGATGAIGFVRQDPLVYALHASPDTGPVDLAAGGSVVVPNLSYGDLAGPLQVEPGVLSLDVLVPAGSGSIFASPQTPPLEAGRRYLAIATGFSGTALPGQSFELLAFEEDFFVDPDPAADARVRVVHASPDAPSPVDVSALDAGGLLAAPVLVPGLFYAQATDPAGAALPSGPLALGVAAAGNSTPAARFDVNLTPGLRAFAIATGALGTAPQVQPFALTLVVTNGATWSAQQVTPTP